MATKPQNQYNNHAASLTLALVRMVKNRAFFEHIHQKSVAQYVGKEESQTSLLLNKPKTFSLGIGLMLMEYLGISHEALKEMADYLFDPSANNIIQRIITIGGFSADSKLLVVPIRKCLREEAWSLKYGHYLYNLPFNENNRKAVLASEIDKVSYLLVYKESDPEVARLVPVNRLDEQSPVKNRVEFKDCHKIPLPDETSEYFIDFQLDYQNSFDVCEIDLTTILECMGLKPGASFVTNLCNLVDTYRSFIVTQWNKRNTESYSLIPQPLAADDSQRGDK